MSKRLVVECWCWVLTIVEKFTLKCKTSDFSWKIYTMTSQKSNLEKEKNPMSKLEVLNVKGYDFLVSFFTVLWSVVKNKTFQISLRHMRNYIRKNIKNVDFIQICQIISFFCNFRALLILRQSFFIKVYYAAFFIFKTALSLQKLSFKKIYGMHKITNFLLKFGKLSTDHRY